jgi:hypothetical protein
MKYLVVWLVGVLMGIGGLYAWSKADGRVQLAFDFGSTATATSPAASPGLQSSSLIVSDTTINASGPFSPDTSGPEYEGRRAQTATPEQLLKRAEGTVKAVRPQ